MTWLKSVAAPFPMFLERFSQFLLGIVIIGVEVVNEFLAFFNNPFLPEADQ